MKNIITFALLLLSLSACSAVETTSTYNNEFTWGRSHSEPVYLAFRSTKGMPFYFLLKSDSNQDRYSLLVRWKNNRKGNLLFNGMDTTLKFLVNNEKIYTYKPVSRPRIVAYNINSKGHEEEAAFSISREDFRKIAYAKSVDVELIGRNDSLSGYFSRHNTFRAFREFYENSY